MADSLNVAKKYVIKYETSGWFSNNGTEALHKVLDLLETDYNSTTDYPEFERDFEVERENMLSAIEIVKAIDRGEETDVDTERLYEVLNAESMTLSELIYCFEFIVSKSDQKNDTILISFF